VIGSPVGSLVPGGVSCGVVVPFLKSTLVTNWVGGATMVLISGPTTWALGKVFIQHFETGGTLLDLNPDEVREYFKAQFQQGRKMATTMNAQEKSEVPG